jgi:hypothetical protein
LRTEQLLAHVLAVSKGLAALGREVHLSIDETVLLEDADSANLFTEISGELTNGRGSSKIIPQRRSKYAHFI